MKLYSTDEVRASKAWPYAIAAGCVVYKKVGDTYKVLLLRREAGHPNDPDQKVASYNLPKGHLAVNDTLEQTAVRETEEEAGVKVEIQTYLGATIHEFVHPRHQMFNSKTTHYFAAAWVSDVSEMDHEHDGSEWCDLSVAKDHLSAPGVKRGEAQFIDRLEHFLEITNS